MDYFLLMLRLQFFFISSVGIYALLNKYQNHRRIAAILPAAILQQLEKSPHRQDVYQLLAFIVPHFAAAEIPKLIEQLLHQDKLIQVKFNLFALNAIKSIDPTILRQILSHSNQNELKKAFSIFMQNKINTPKLYHLLLQHRTPVQLALAIIERNSEIVSIDELFQHPHCPLALIRAFQYLEDRHLLSIEHYEHCLHHSSPQDLAVAIDTLNQHHLSIVQENLGLYTHAQPKHLMQLVLELNQLKLLDTRTIQLSKKHHSPLDAANLLNFLKTTKLLKIEDIDKILTAEISADDLKNFQLIQAVQMLSAENYQLILDHPYPMLLQQALLQLQQCKLLNRAHLDFCLSKGSKPLFAAINILFQAQLLNPTTNKIIFNHAHPQSIAKILSLVHLDSLTQDLLKTILSFFDPYHLSLSLDCFHRHQSLNREHLILTLNLIPIASLADILKRLEHHKILNKSDIPELLAHQNLAALCSCIELLIAEGLLNKENFKHLLGHDDLGTVLNILDILQENQQLTPTQLLRTLSHRMPRALALSLTQFFDPNTGLVTKTPTELNTVFRDYPCILVKGKMVPAILEKPVLQQIINICHSKTLELKQKQQAIMALLRPNTYLVYLAQIENNNLETLIMTHLQLFLDSLRTARSLQECIWKLNCLSRLRTEGLAGIWPLLKAKILADFFQTYHWLYLNHSDPLLAETIKINPRIGLSEEFLNNCETKLKAKFHTISGHTSAVFHPKNSQILCKSSEERTAIMP